MSKSKDKEKINSKEYEWLAERYSVLCSERQAGENKNNCEWRRIRSEQMTGQTKENSERCRKSSESQKGRTKENNESVARRAETLSNRTKDTHEYLAIIGQKNSIHKKGQTKENNESVARMAETLSNRTKDTHGYLMNHSIKMTGRTKETHPGIKVASEKRQKLTIEQRILLINMKDSGLSNGDIFTHFSKDLGLDISYSSISSLYTRNKHLLEIDK